MTIFFKLIILVFFLLVIVVLNCDSFGLFIFSSFTGSALSDSVLSMVILRSIDNDNLQMINVQTKDNTIWH